MGNTRLYGSENDDLFLVKAEADGIEAWRKTFGGSKDDYGKYVQETCDGGFIIVGFTESFGAGSADVYLIKTDADGNEDWSNTFDGSGYDSGWCVQQTDDGGYIIAGNTLSSGAGASDVYLIKTDADGDEEWSRTFGGAFGDWGRSVQPTSDGGYIVAGITYSYEPYHLSDVYLIKTDSAGNQTWSKVFHKDGSARGECVRQTSDGGFIITGKDDTSTGDVYLIKTDSSGDEEWSKTFGGSEDDGGESVRQTSEGGFIIGGTTYSMGVGGSDAWLIKTDSDGNEDWNQTFGGIGYDYGKAVQILNDSCYILAGSTSSFGAGQYDAYLVHYCADVCECDLNTNGRCDMSDYFLFGQDWGRTDCNEPGVDPCECDLDHEGDCDMADYFLFGQDWGRTDCPIP